MKIMVKSHKMNQEIRSLLNKKKLTGAEVGRAFIMNCLNQHGSKELIFANDEFSILSSKVIGKSENDQCNAYINLHTWIHRYSTLVQAYYQQLYVGYSTLFFKVNYTLIAEQGLHNLQKLTKNHKVEDSTYQNLKIFTKNILFDFSLFAYWDDNTDIEFTKEGRDQLKKGLVEILSYNKAVDLLADFLKMPEFSQVLKIDTVKLYAAINLLNDRIVLLRSHLFGSPEEVKRKEKFLDKLYPVFDLSDYEPTKEAVKKATTSLKKHILQNDPYQIIKALKRKL